MGWEVRDQKGVWACGRQDVLAEIWGEGFSWDEEVIRRARPGVLTFV
jgi:hypothetical protein